MQRLVVPQGTFDLQRYPVRKHEQLRAWDAADEYLLAHLAESEELDLGRLAGAGPILIVNDHSGALSTVLAEHRPAMLGDSFVAECATAANVERNGRAPEDVAVLRAFDPLPDPLGLVLVRIPKSTALLEEQLRHLAPSLGPDTVVIGAAMAKHVHTSTIECFETFIGPTRTSLARRKARLLFSQPDLTLRPGPSDWPMQYSVREPHVDVVDQAGVFSAGRLDAGTRLFLEHLPETEGSVSIVDLGCGNGVLGTAAALQNAHAEVTFVDESPLAVASARATFRANLGDDRHARFAIGDCLDRMADGEPIEADRTDLILTNPPFHDNHALGDAVAWQMFASAHRALAPGGDLWVVGNRHLAYHAKLRRLFGNCTVVASNAKFVILRATRQRVPNRDEPNREP